MIKGGISAVTVLIENFDKLLTTLTAVGIRFTALKMPTWFPKLYGFLGGNRQVGAQVGQRAATWFNGGKDPSALGFKIVGGEGATKNALNPTVRAIDSQTTSIVDKMNEILNVMRTREGTRNVSATPLWNKDNNSYTPAGGTYALKRGDDGKFHYFNSNGKQLNRRVSAARIQEAENAELEMQKLEESQKIGARRSRLTGAAAAGIGAGLMAAINKSTIGNGAFDRLWNKTGQTVEADAGDKAIQGVSTAVSTGLMSAIPGVGPILGPILGPIIGDGIGGLFTWLRHKDELDRKQRVEEAKEELQMLNEISEGIINNQGLFNKTNWDADDYASAKEYVDTFSDLMRKQTGAMAIFLENIETINSELGTLTYDELMNKLINGSSNEKQDIMQAANLAVLREEREKMVAANEETTYNVKDLLSGKAIDSGYQYGAGIRVTELRDTINANKDDGTISRTKDGRIIYLSGSTLEEQRTNAEKLKKEMEEAYINGDVASKREGAIAATWAGLATPLGIGTLTPSADWAAADGMQEYIKQLDEFIDKCTEAEAELNKINKQLIDQNVQIGYITSGVSSLTQDELMDKTLQGVIDDIANAIEKEGVAVRNAAGVIKSEYLTAINAQIKSDSKMAQLLKGEAITYNKMSQAQSKLAAVTGQNAKDAYNLLRPLLDFADDDNVARFNAIALSLGVTADELRNLVYQADPQNLYNLSNALHMSTEELEKMSEVLGNISLADALMSPSEVREKFSDYLTFFEDLVDGNFSQENLENYITNHPELLNNKGDVSKIREQLIQEMFDSNNANSILYQNAIFGEILNNKDIFTQFKTQNKDLVDSLDKDMQEAFENNKSFDGLWNAIFNYDGTAKEELQKAMDDLFESFAFSYTSEEHKKIMEIIIEYQTRLIDEQIDNLQKQKDALADINNEREKELELIKAKEALENARKEKKQIYRQGIGFVYEADEEAIAEAQQNLDKLDTEGQQDAIQREIDALELQKEILDYLPDIETIQAQKEIYETWASKIEETGAIVENVPDVISAIADNFSSVMSIAVDDLKKLSEGNVQEQNTLNSSDVSTALAEYQKAVGELGNYTKGTFAYNKQIETINSRFDALNSAVKTAQTNGVEYKDADTIDSILNAGRYDKSTVSVTTEGVQKDKTENMQFLEGEGTEVTEGDIDKQFAKDKYTYVKLPYNDKNELDTETPTKWGYLDKDGKFNSSWLKLSDYNNLYQKAINKDSLTALPLYTILGNQDYDNYYAYVGQGEAGKQLHWLSTGGKADVGRMATGTYDLQGNGWTGLVNELGTEGIVTPQGTFTALPSHTGIVPADITKNVWQLGEVAPELIAQLDSLKKANYISNNTGVTNNDTVNIDKVIVQPTESYNMDKLIADVKAKANITKHNN